MSNESIYFLYTIQKLYLYYYLSKNSLGYIYSRKAMVENLTITMDDSSENKTRHAMTQGINLDE